MARTSSNRPAKPTSKARPRSRKRPRAKKKLNINYPKIIATFCLLLLLAVSVGAVGYVIFFRTVLV